MRLLICQVPPGDVVPSEKGAGVHFFNVPDTAGEKSVWLKVQVLPPESVSLEARPR